MTTIVMPMAGAGSRFVAEGFKDPKPLIEVCGEPMFMNAWYDAVDALGEEPSLTVLLVRKEHRVLVEKAWGKVNGYGLEVVFVEVPELTDGAASTVQLAEDFIAPDEDVLVTNCDQLVGLSSLQKWVFAAARYGEDPVVFCFDGKGASKWSYLHQGKIIEKPAVVPAGAPATCGVYWFPEAGEMFDAIRAMKAVNDRTNGEFYFAPCLNYIECQPKALAVEEMVGLGTPEDLRAYLASFDCAPR